MIKTQVSFEIGKICMEIEIGNGIWQLEFASNK